MRLPAKTLEASIIPALLRTSDDTAALIANAPMREPSTEDICRIEKSLTQEPKHRLGSCVSLRAEPGRERTSGTWLNPHPLTGSRQVAAAVRGR
jgi:hypothetical protein